MRSARFDAWAKTRARADRRRLLRGLAATMLAALTGQGVPVVDAPSAAAQSRQSKKRRRRRAGAAATKCGLVGDACAGNGDCCPGSVCRTPAGGGPTRCRCRYRRSECGGKCWVLDTSERNCGACGNRCPAGVTCQNGQCGAPGDDHFVVAPGHACAQTPLEPDNASRTICGGTLLNVQANDPHDSPRIVHFDKDALPAHGKISIFDGSWDPNYPLGGFVYRPDPGFKGIDTFGYRLCTIGADQTCIPLTVVVAVSSNAPNKPPAASEHHAAVSVGGAPARIDVLANAHDPDGDALRLIYTFPGRLNGPRPEIEVNGDGTVTYRSPSGFVGDDWFYYVITDDWGGVDTGLVVVTVNA
ncbi:MAG TPA: Ig-like domain-containing protein [Thermomicrobiales bacterium]|nr:Ig-like domain-containing protein [Thermomicrobiales bacterium]